MNSSAFRFLPRAVAMAVLLIVGLVVWALILQPVQEVVLGRRAEISNLQKTLLTLRDEAARGETFLATLPDLEAHPVFASGIFTESTDALASASLQRRVRTIVQTGGGSIQSTQALKARNEGDLRTTPVRVVFRATVVSLQKILHAVETSTPYLYVQELEIRAATARAVAPALVGSPVLSVRMDVYGFRRKSENES